MLEQIHFSVDVEKREELVLEKWSMLSDGKGLSITNNDTLKDYAMGSFSIEEDEPQDFPGEVLYSASVAAL